MSILSAIRLWVRDRLILDAPETHPDTLSSQDLRSRGFDPVDGVLEYEQHRARMDARQAQRASTLFTHSGEHTPTSKEHTP